MSANIIQCEFFDPNGTETLQAADYFKSIGLYFAGESQHFWIELRQYPQVLTEIETDKYFGNRHKSECFYNLSKISNRGATIYVVGERLQSGMDNEKVCRRIPGTPIGQQLVDQLP